LPKSPLTKICELCEVFLSIQTLTNNARGEVQVERAKVIKEEIQQQGISFLAVYVEAKNSIMIMLSEKEDKLGTLAIAVPKPKDLLGSVTSSVLLGDKNVISSRMLAEYVASKKGKIAMVSVYLETVTEVQAQSFFMHLVEKLLKSESSKKEPTAI
jgi:hypothetical protein